MSSARPPAQIVMCAPVPPGGTAAASARALGGPLGAGIAPPVPVNWLATPDTLALALVCSGGQAPTLLVDPADLSARATLRDAIRRGRQIAPGLDTLALRVPLPAAVREVLVQEAIRVVLVPAFETGARGGRRPAPRGWPCRSLAWGVWEVSSQPPVSRGLGAWLTGWSAGPVIRRGGLHVLVAEGPGAGGRLQAWTTWAARQAERGTIRVIRLADLPDVIARDGQTGLGGSVLRAA